MDGMNEKHAKMKEMMDTMMGMMEEMQSMMDEMMGETSKEEMTEGKPNAEMPVKKIMEYRREHKE